MPTVNITIDNFQQTIQENGMVILDWWADWCGPCKAFAPTFEKKSEEHPDIIFGKIDTEANQELSQMANITSIPTLMIFRDQILLFSQAGALPPAQLEEIIQATKDLNMDEVRAEIARQQSGTN
jgi:thioredoxin 1